MLTDVGMPYFRDEFELRRFDRVVFGENEMAFEEASLVRSVGGSDDHDFPFENVTLVDDAGAKAFHRVLVQFLKLLTQQKGRLILRGHRRFPASKKGQLQG